MKNKLTRPAAVLLASVALVAGTAVPSQAANDDYVAGPGPTLCKWFPFLCR